MKPFFPGQIHFFYKTGNKEILLTISQPSAELIQYTIIL